MARTKKFYSCNKNQPDPIYASKFIQMINQRLMRHGKKKLAYRILQECLNHIKNKKQDPLLIIEKAIRNTTPSIKIQKRRIGGAVYPIPIELKMDQGMPQAVGWILTAAKKRRPGGHSGRGDLRNEARSPRRGEGRGARGPRTSVPLAINLANEFIDASNKLGTAFYKKEEIHKIAEANIRSKNFNKSKVFVNKKS